MWIDISSLVWFYSLPDFNKTCVWIAEFSSPNWLNCIFSTSKSKYSVDKCLTSHGQLNFDSHDASKCSIGIKSKDQDQSQYFTRDIERYIPNFTYWVWNRNFVRGISKSSSIVKAIGQSIGDANVFKMHPLQEKD